MIEDAEEREVNMGETHFHSPEPTPAIHNGFVVLAWLSRVGSEPPMSG